MKMTFCRLARPGLQLPMPGSNRLFSERGETVDAEAPFWAVLLKDRDIVEGAETAEGPETPSPGSPNVSPEARRGDPSSPAGGEVAPAGDPKPPTAPEKPTGRKGTKP